MKNKKILALLFALLMVLSAATLASAESSEKYFGYEDNYYTLTNGKTASFFLLPSSHTLYGSDGTSYQDVIYDCEGPVSATVKSGSSWISVTNTMNSFIITFSSNNTQKVRTGKVLVKGDGYKATMKFTQYGIDKILSIKRSKKTITAKFKLASGSKAHYLNISDEARKEEDGITWYSNENDVFSGKFSKTSYKVTARKNHSYWFGIGPAIPVKTGGYINDTTSYGGMYVTELTGTQTPDYIYTDGQ